MVSNLAAAIVGAIVGGLLVLAAEGLTRDLPASPPAPSAMPSSPVPGIGIEARTIAPDRTTLLAWSPGGIPVTAERALEAIPGVVDATIVAAGLDWIRSSRSDDGSVVDDPGPGFAIPVEVAVVDPAGYASHVPPSEREAILALQPGQVLLSESAARIRGAGRGLNLRFKTGNFDVATVISDVAANGYEVLRAGEVPRAWERVDRFVLVRVRHASVRRKVERVMRAELEPQQTLRIRAQGETPFLRYGDAVLPQSQIKAVFGEFPATPNRDGSLSIPPGWKATNIASRRVPILGVVTCHRAVFPQLVHALREIRHAGLAFTVDSADYGGCFSPRFIDSNPAGRISHHSWGIAIDLNVAQNRPGTKPDIDKRVVGIMEANGFTWGGRWLVPDGMHFEWARFP